MRFLLFFLLLPKAYADCYWTNNDTFFTCGTLGSYKSVGRTLPHVADGIRFNPAALPTVPTPVGVEATYSTRSLGDKKLQVSLVKGLPRIGLGIVNWTENSFSTPNIYRYLNSFFQSTYANYQRSSQEGFRASLAFAVPLLGDWEKFLKISVGASLGQGRVSGSTANAVGATFDIPLLSFGLSTANETISPLLPKTVNRTYSLGYHYNSFYLGYSRMNFRIGDYRQKPIHFYSMRWSTADWAVYAAIKKDQDLENRSDTTYSANIQKQWGKIILAYMYGLYPRSHSLSTQFYF